MVLHAAFSSEDAVVVDVGTDVLILIIYLTFMVKRRIILNVL